MIGMSGLFFGSLARGLRARVLTLMLLCGLTAGAWSALASAGENQPARWQAYNESLQKDATLLRHYLFPEGKGTTTANAAAGGVGALSLTSVSPFGESREPRWRWWGWPHFIPAADWVPGRWAGKHALINGYSTNHAVTRSLFNGTPDGIFTLLAWVQIYGDPQTAPEGVCRLFNIGDAYKKGWSISYGRYKWQPEGGIEFRFGVPDGAAIVNVKSFAPQVWHQLACLWDGKALKVYVDGALAGEKPCAGPYVAGEPLIESYALGMLEYEVGGLNIGGRQNFKQTPERFAVDELAIFSRALSDAEIRAHYEAGKPETDASMQKAELAQQLAERRLQDAIRMTIPVKTNGYFQRGQKIPATIAVGAEAGLSGSYTAHFLLRDQNNQVMAQEARPLELVAGKEASVVEEFAPKQCGVYFLDLWLTDAAGKTIKRLKEEYGIGITVELPPAAQVPPTSPLAAHYISGTFPENRFLGFGVDRWIKSNEITNKQGKVNEEAYQEEFAFEEDAGLKVMFCLHLFSPEWAEKVPGKKWLMKDMSVWAEYCKLMVNRYRDRVVAWEIENEPNAGNLVPPEEYAEFLKVGYEAIKLADPKAVVVGLCGCPGFLNWNEAVYKAGGAKYFDVMSLHNYVAFPIRHHRQERQVERAIEQLIQYRGEAVPVWNSETGFIFATRVDGRPMTADVFTRRFAAKLVAQPGQPPMCPGFQPVLLERDAASWQVQSVLLDLGAGCQKYFMLAGGSHYYPIYNNADGQPSDYGVATAAMASALMYSKGAKFLPLSSGADVGVVITGNDGKRMVALFSDETPTLSFRWNRPGVARGMDMLGNPQEWPVSEGGIVSVRAGREAIYLFDVPDGFEQVRVVSIDGLPKTLAESGILEGAVTVNNPFARPLNGVLLADAPKGAKVEVQATLALQPGESRTVPFRMDGRALKRRAYEVGFALMDGQTQLGKASHAFFSEGGIRAVKEVAAGAQIGDGRWWAGMEPEICAEEENVVHGKPVVGVPWTPHWEGAQDLSYRVRQGWAHDGAVLVRIEVRDNVVMPASKENEKLGFRYDCLELFFDGRPLAERKQVMTAGVEQMVVIPRVGEGAGACGFWFAGKAPTVEASFVGGSLPDGYWIEGRIAPAQGQALRVRVGTQYALDVMIDDMDKADTPRKAAMALHGEFNNATDPSKWGRYQLQPGVDGKR